MQHDRHRQHVVLVVASDMTERQAVGEAVQADAHQRHQQRRRVRLARHASQPVLDQAGTVQPHQKRDQRPPTSQFVTLGDDVQQDQAADGHVDETVQRHQHRAFDAGQLVQNRP